MGIYYKDIIREQRVFITICCCVFPCIIRKQGSLYDTLLYASLCEVLAQMRIRAILALVPVNQGKKQSIFFRRVKFEFKQHPTSHQILFNAVVWKGTS